MYVQYLFYKYVCIVSVLVSIVFFNPYSMHCAGVQSPVSKKQKNKINISKNVTINNDCLYDSQTEL